MDMNEDPYAKGSLSRAIKNHATGIDNCLCPAVQIQYSWLSLSEVIDLQKMNENVTYLQVALSKHSPKKRPVSCFIFCCTRRKRTSGTVCSALRK